MAPTLVCDLLARNPQTEVCATSASTFHMAQKHIDDDVDGLAGRPREVGRWLPLDDYYLYHRLLCFGPCEMLEAEWHRLQSVDSGEEITD